MNSPKELNIEDFTYLLPDARIARYPLAARDHSKLLVCDGRGELQQTGFSKLPDFLPEHSLLVLNNTRVIHARLRFQKESGARIELFCLNPVFPVSEMQKAFSQTSAVVWECLVGNAKRWKTGILSQKRAWNGREVTLFVERPAANGETENAESIGDAKLLKFSWLPQDIPFAEIIEHFGDMPLPPYLKREAEENDEIAYQTVYAAHDGSVAAPTAGLHFTEDVFESLARKGIQADYLTLHVGAGTFRPVTTALIGDHPMHPEPFFVSRELLERLIEKKYAGCYAVGTTSVRSLESLYWFGVKLLNEAENPFFLDQWEVYESLPADVPLAQSLLQLLAYMDEHQMDTIEGVTRLIIAPGYKFRLIEGMITNFHQPGSTLLLLVAALLGENWKHAYQYALDHDFRFLSFGDSCLFFKQA